MSSRALKSVLTLLLLLGILLNASGVVDRAGKNFIDATLNRALFSFAIARGLNAVLSIAQGTELSVEPLGIGLTLTPGQALDPVNDLIERFSWIMLASSAAVGVQEIFLEISAWPVMRWLISIVLALTISALWLASRRLMLLNHLIRLSILLLFVRFCIPSVFILNELTYQQFLAARYQQSTQSIEQANAELEILTSKMDSEVEQQSTEQPEKSMLETWTERINITAALTAEITKLKEKMQKFQTIAAETTNYILDLIVIFLLQTVIFPLLFMLGFYKMAIYLTKIDFLT